MQAVKWGLHSANLLQLQPHKRLLRLPRPQCRRLALAQLQARTGRPQHWLAVHGGGGAGLLGHAPALSAALRAGR